jgi:hypothetical protein
VHRRSFRQQRWTPLPRSLPYPLPRLSGTCRSDSCRLFVYAADRTGRYRPIILFGYTLQMIGRDSHYC